jgi:hypothetical protein
LCYSGVAVVLQWCCSGVVVCRGEEAHHCGLVGVLLLGIGAYSNQVSQGVGVRRYCDVDVDVDGDGNSDRDGVKEYQGLHTFGNTSEQEK